MAKRPRTLAPRRKSSRSFGSSPNFAAVFRTQAFMVTTNLPIRLAHRLTSRLRDYANFSSPFVDFALLVPLAEASAVGFFRRCPADEYDGNHIVVEPPVDSCRPTAADAAAQPSRLHLRARHASIANKTTINQSVRTDSVVIDTLAVHRTTQREDKTNSESSAVYKPPDGSIVLIILAMAFIFFFFINKRR